MPKFKLEIELGNDQMSNAKHVARALHVVARQMAELGERDDDDLEADTILHPIKDLNGNKVGTYKVSKS